MSLTSDFLKYSGAKALAKEGKNFGKEAVRQLCTGWGKAFTDNFKAPKKKYKCKK